MLNKRRLLYRTIRPLAGVLLKGRNAGRISVLNYHRILPKAKSLEDVKFDPGVYDTGEIAFAEQLQFMLDRFCVLGLDEFTRLIESGTTPRRRAVLITFDDAYKEVFTVAAPLLKAKGLPAVAFIPSRRVERRELEAWEQACFCVRQAAPKERELVFETDKLTILPGKGEAASAAVSRLLVGKYSARQEWFLEMLAEQLDSTLPTGEQMDGQIMTVEELRALRAQGFAIGSHAHSHRPLALLSPPELREELVSSRRILEEMLDCQVASIAYPHGKRNGHYDRNTIKEAKDAGYRLGFNYMGGLVNPRNCDPLDLNRMPVSRPDSVAFEALLQGLSI
jgi:peptidoglycan/xylan/chitin deacetylase (PgdA/CDA1 family)